MAEYLQTTIDKFTFRVATDRLYTSDGVWVTAEQSPGSHRVRIGVTDYLQQHNGDVAFANVKPQGTTLKAGDDCAELETMKVNVGLPSPVSGKIVAVNESAARSLGYERQAYPGGEITSIRDIMAPEARAGFAHYLETIRARGALDGIMAVQTRTGERRFWEYHNTLRTEGVETPVVRGLAFDITERLRSEDQLREAQKFSEEIVSSAGEGIIVYDRDWRYRVWNRFMEHLTGLRTEQVLGKRAVVADQVLDLTHRMQHGGVVASAEAPADLGQRARLRFVALDAIGFEEHLELHRLDCEASHGDLTSLGRLKRMDSVVVTRSSTSTGPGRCSSSNVRRTISTPSR